MKTQIINLNCKESLKLEWLDDFSICKVNCDNQEINETLNNKEIKRGKSYKIGDDLIFIQLKKRFLEKTKLEILLNGQNYNTLGQKYDSKMFSLSIVYSFFAAASIINYFDFYNITLITIISGLFYLSVGYLFFRSRKLIIGLGILFALISEIVARLIISTENIQVLNIPDHILMKIFMALFILIAINYAMKEKKNKNTLANKQPSNGT